MLAAPAEGMHVDQPPSYPALASGTLVADAALQANEIQDLADQAAAVVQLRASHKIRFRVRIELPGEPRPGTRPGSIERPAGRNSARILAALGRDGESCPASLRATSWILAKRDMVKRRRSGAVQG